MRTLTGVILVVIIGLAVYWWQLQPDATLRATAGCYGLPQTQQRLIDRLSVHVLNNNGFVVGYSELYANPLWVSYRLSDPAYPKPASRPREFSADPRSFRGIEADALRGSGYQRGHLAPSYAMYRVHGPQAQRDSFLMTNISPQLPALNQKLWQRLEEVIMDRLLPQKDRLCVITGPLFKDQPRILASGVAVPEAFYKILVDPGDAPQVLAFLMPQKVQGDEPLDSYLTTIDEIERRSGIDFLSALDDATEAELESRLGDDWGLRRFARLPARY